MRDSWICRLFLDITRPPWTFPKESLGICCMSADSTGISSELLWISKLCIFLNLKTADFLKMFSGFRQFLFFPVVLQLLKSLHLSPSPLSFILYFIFILGLIFFNVELLCFLFSDRVLYTSYWCYLVLQPHHLHGLYFLLKGFRMLRGSWSMFKLSNCGFDTCW